MLCLLLSELAGEERDSLSGRDAELICLGLIDERDTTLSTNLVTSTNARRDVAGVCLSTLHVVVFVATASRSDRQFGPDAEKATSHIVNAVDEKVTQSVSSELLRCVSLSLDRTAAAAERSRRFNAELPRRDTELRCDLRDEPLVVRVLVHLVHLLHRSRLHAGAKHEQLLTTLRLTTKPVVHDLLVVRQLLRRPRLTLCCLHEQTRNCAVCVLRMQPRLALHVQRGDVHTLLHLAVAVNGRGVRAANVVSDLIGLEPVRDLAVSVHIFSDELATREAVQNLLIRRRRRARNEALIIEQDLDRARVDRAQ